MDFNDALDLAEKLRDRLKAQRDHIVSGKPITSVPEGFTKDSWVEAIEEQIESLDKSLRDYGR